MWPLSSGIPLHSNLPYHDDRGATWFGTHLLLRSPFLPPSGHLRLLAVPRHSKHIPTSGLCPCCALCLGCCSVRYTQAHFIQMPPLQGCPPCPFYLKYPAILTKSFFYHRKAPVHSSLCVLRLMAASSTRMQTLWGQRICLPLVQGTFPGPVTLPGLCWGLSKYLLNN